MTKQYSDLDQHEALYNVARDYPGGIVALAHRMGKNSAVLRQKLSPDVKNHFTYFEEASEIMEKCQGANVPDALAPLYAMNWRHGLIAFPMPEVSNIADEELTQSVCKVMSELGDVAKEIGVSLSNDGKITEDELEKIEKQIQEALAATAELRHRVHLRAQQDKGKA